MGVTTSWAGMFYSVPVDLKGQGKVKFGVSAVSLDMKKESAMLGARITKSSIAMNIATKSRQTSLLSSQTRLSLSLMLTHVMRLVTGRLSTMVQLLQPATMLMKSRLRMV